MTSLEELKKQLDPTPTVQDVRTAKPVVMDVLRAAHPKHLQFRELVEGAVLRCAGIPFRGLPPDFHRETPEVVSTHVRWAAAVGEALNDLYHAGLIVPRQYNTFLLQSYVPSKRPGEETFRYFDERQIFEQWRLTYRGSDAADRDFLFDPDLYLQRARLDDAHQRIQTSVSEAVTAYVKEMYLAAATMLGSASEGAWLEFFGAFESWAKKQGAPAPSVDQWHVAEHVQKLVSNYQGTAGFNGIMKSADVSAHELKALVQDYDYFRDVRNYAAHFDTTDRFDLTHAGVGLMLLAAARYFDTVYKLIGSLRS